MHELSERIFDLSEVMGREGAQLETGLAEAPNWDSRFDILDQFLLRRISEARPVGAPVRHAWNRLCGSGGMIFALSPDADCASPRSIRIFAAKESVMSETSPTRRDVLAASAAAGAANLVSRQPVCG